MKNASYYREVARNSLKNNWGNAVIVCLIVSLIVSALSATGIGAVAVLVVAGPLEVGTIYYFLKLIKKENAEIGTLFYKITDNFVDKFLASILMSVYICLWSLLFVIPGIVKSFSYSMTMFIMAKDPTIKANDAITLSRKMMNGNKARLFSVLLSFIGWFILSAFTFGIGYLFLTPYVNAAKSAFFEDIYNNYVDENGAQVNINIETPSSTESNDAPEIVIE